MAAGVGADTVRDWSSDPSVRRRERTRQRIIFSPAGRAACFEADPRRMCATCQFPLSFNISLR